MYRDNDDNKNKLNSLGYTVNDVYVISTRQDLITREYYCTDKDGNERIVVSVKNNLYLVDSKL